MSEYPKISDAEWKVMQVVWKKHPCTSSEIIKALKEDTTWNPKTIHTLIDRLVKKEALTAVKDSSFYEYTPKFTEKQLSHEETKSFVKKIYNGSINLLIANFLKEEKLTSEEIKELKDILDNKKSE